jgi:hypothetical protein
MQSISQGTHPLGGQVAGSKTTEVEMNKHVEQYEQGDVGEEKRYHEWQVPPK